MSRSLLLAGCLAVSLVASPAWLGMKSATCSRCSWPTSSFRRATAPSEAIKKLVAILKHHPRFQEDFAGSMPKGLNEDGEARWLLCRASVWPDQIRMDRENRAVLSSPAGQARLVSSRDLALHRYAAGDRRRGHRRRAGQGLGREGPGRQELAADAPAAESGRQERAAGDRFQSRKARSTASPRNRRLPSAGCCTRWATSTSRCTRRRVFRRGARSGGPPPRRRGRQRDPAWPKGGICTPSGTPRPMPARSDVRSRRTVRPRYNRAYDRALKQIDSLLADNALASARQAGRSGKGPEAMGPREFRSGQRQGLYRRNPQADPCRRSGRRDRPQPACSCNCPTATGTGRMKSASCGWCKAAIGPRSSSRAFKGIQRP